MQNMKVLLINFTEGHIENIKTELNNSNIEFIQIQQGLIDHDNTEEALGINRKELTKAIQDHDTTIVYMNNESFHINTLLNIITEEDEYEVGYNIDGWNNVVFVIDASEFTEEEQCLLDECIEDVSDLANLVIIDDSTEIIKICKNIIEAKYKESNGS